MVSFEVQQFDVEAGYDYVELMDTGGRSLIERPVGGAQGISGTLDALPTTTFETTGPRATVEFSADESLAGQGFEIEYSCGRPGGGRGGGGPPPPPAAQQVRPRSLLWFCLSLA